MPFVSIPGISGKIYVPEEKPGETKKHNCKDCFSCQMCSDDRCMLCRGKKACEACETKKSDFFKNPISDHKLDE